MKTFLTLLASCVVSLSAEPSVVLSLRQVRTSMEIKVSNPNNEKIAIQASFDLINWGYLGSTTNKTATFIDCDVVNLYPKAFYRAVPWNGPQIPTLPPCSK